MDISLTDSERTCLNCGTVFSDKFCNHCGQKKISGRLSVKEFLHNAVHNFTHVDKGILFLAKELFLRPGIVAREYIEGKRKKYFNPFQYLIILVALSTFLTLNLEILGPKINEALLNSADQQVKFSAGMNRFFYKYYNVVLFFSVPVVAFFSRLMFRRSGFNFAENLLFITLISAQRTLMFILLTPLFLLTKNIWYVGIGFYYLAWSVYFIYAYIQFYGEGTLVTVLKYLGIFIISLAVMQALAFLIVSLFVL